MALRLYLFWVLMWWAWLWLALGHLGDQPPDWLIRTRQVCFGSQDNGLPDVHGWISLAAPWPMLGALLALSYRELREGIINLWRPARYLLLLAPWVGFLYGSHQVAQAPPLVLAPISGPLPSDYPNDPQTLGQFQLQDLKGRAVGPTHLAGSKTILLFAYGHCKTVCPALMHNCVSAARASASRLVVIGLDPWRDNCGSWSNIAKGWELPERSEVWTGTPTQTQVVTKAFGVPCERDPQTGEITHPALVFLVDHQGRIVYRFNNPSQEWLLQGLSRL